MWSDYSGNDSDGDLIGDDPYTFNGVIVDYSPLIYQPRFYNGIPYTYVSWVTDRNTTYFKIMVLEDSFKGNVYINYWIGNESYANELSNDPYIGVYSGEVPHINILHVKIVVVPYDEPPVIEGVSWSPGIPWGMSLLLSMLRSLMITVLLLLFCLIMMVLGIM